METDNDYDVANDYLDRVKLVAYTEKMSGKKTFVSVKPWKSSNETTKPYVVKGDNLYGPPSKTRG